MSNSLVSQSTFTDIAFFGMRMSIGAIFIVHSLGKFQPGFANFLTKIGIPLELQIIIALAELIPGILLIVGVLSRISGAILSIVMLGAIIIVKGATSLTGDGGYELDLLLLTSALVIMVAGPGRISISHIAKKIPRPLH